MNINRHKFLKEFITAFFDKGKTKRKTNKNKSIYITDVINQVFAKYYELTIKFSQSEIIESFHDLGFQVVESEKSVKSGIIGKNGFELNECHIIIDTMLLTRLFYANRKSYPSNMNPSKVVEIHKLKEDLKKFRSSTLVN